MGPGCSLPTGTVGPPGERLPHGQQDVDLKPMTTDAPQHLRLSSRWSGVNARETAHRIVARASLKTYHAQTYASATHIVKMTLIRIMTIVNQMMTVMGNVLYFDPPLPHLLCHVCIAILHVIALDSLTSKIYG